MPASQIGRDLVGWGRDTAFRFFISPPVYGMLQLVAGFRIVGKENAQGFSGGLVVCNHTHHLDLGLVSRAVLPQPLRYAVQVSNLNIPFVGKFLSAMECIPVERGSAGVLRFDEKARKLLSEGKCVVVYPEGNLRPFEQELQPFYKGVFHVAVSEQVPILPIVAIPEVAAHPHWWHRAWARMRGRKPRSFLVEVLPVVWPETPSSPEDKRRCVAQMRDEVFHMMDRHMRGLDT